MALTFDAAVTEVAERAPDSTALVLGERRTSFAELVARGRRLAGYLDGHLVDAPRRVGFLGGHGPDFFTLAVACSLQGVVLVDLDQRRGAAALATAVRDADLATVLASPDLLPLLDAVEDLPVLTTGPILDAVLAAQDGSHVVSRSSPDDVLLALRAATGTVSEQGARLTHVDLTGHDAGRPRSHGPAEPGVHLVPTSLLPVGGAGQAATAMTRGSTTVLVADTDPGTLLAAIERERVSHALVVPAVVRSLLDDGRLATTDVSSLRTVACPGAPMSSELRRAAVDALGCDVLDAAVVPTRAATSRPSRRSVG